MSTRITITLDYNKDSDASMFDKLAKLSNDIEDIDDMFIKGVQIYKEDTYDED